MRVLKLIGIVLCALLLIAMVKVARAQVPPTCEQEYYDVLSKRAWLEGKREMEMAQRIILKADSVLEYSCFNDRLADLEGPGSDWSDGNPWQDDVAGVQGGSMSSKSNLLIRQPLGEYLGRNFGHTYGGGTYPTSLNTCKGMYIIFDFLKCHNFDKGLFMTFDELVNRDPRDKPTLCPPGDRSTKWSDNLRDAFPDPATPAPPGGMDQKITYIGNMWGDCDDVDPIPTGIFVESNGAYGGYEEHVCLPPGCSYNGSECQ